MSDKNNKLEPLLPSPEILERYKRLGFGENLVELVRVEQKHRHSLQRKYATSYRLGQFSGFLITLYCLVEIFRLINKGLDKQAYILTLVFSALVLLVSLIVRKNRDDLIKRRRQRSEGTFDAKRSSVNAKSYPYRNRQ
ncbi:MAG: hypothetical protein LBG48_05765 [Rickettsiales bacterium]|jgi:uncharacterized membrane protein|nr:hypothetical protein [Rickettsiales bacterium]